MYETEGLEAVLLMSVSDFNTNSSFFLENQTSLMILLFLPAVSQFFQELSLKFISEISLAASHPLPPQSVNCQAIIICIISLSG